MLAVARSCEAAYILVMSSPDIQEILKLSVVERLRLVEDIWDSIAVSPELLPVTDAQKKELDRRLAVHEARPDEARSWDEIRGSLDRER